MFIPDSLSPCACKRTVTLNGRTAIRVALHTVQFTTQGMAAIGLGMIEMSRTYGIPLGIIRNAMKKNLYSAPPSDSLYFLFHLKELDADMHIEIPPHLWRFTAPGM
ncbi:MAG: hypothetical protein HY795_06310 [Desulfovibrio sp.]|nr:hypothetical protein [Desulfovibrio sp.]MBI4961288.1 hypothetical protein [Desulfovibrio sp.]